MAVTRAVYDRMVDSGALEGLHVELLDGEIVEVNPQGAAHYRLVSALTVWFAPRAELLGVQGPLAAAEDSEPEPDIALLAEPIVVTGIPTSALLAVEIVVSQRPQAIRKARIYARAEVPAYWIVDEPRRLVLVHSGPTPYGYARTAEVRGEDMLSPPAGLPPKTVDELFRSAGL
jgi:Uma2 family endonuclease